MKAIIMAGGRGSRIASVAGDIPKPMMRVHGKTILERQIENLNASGITSITIVVGYLGRVIEEYFMDGKKWGASITYFEEKEEKPLGTAGALFYMKERGEIESDFILMCGDLVIDIDFERLISFHEKKKKEGALATLLVHPNSHPYDSALIETEKVLDKAGGIPRETGRVTAWLGRKRDGTDEGDREGVYRKNCVNSGIQVLTPELLDITKDASHLPEKVDLDRDVLQKAVKTGRIYALNTTEYICDMGTPERYRQVISDVESGITHRRNLRFKQRAVFLDRDGTLNRDIPFINTADKLELLPGASKAVSLINKAGYLAVVITNQSVIARGEATWEDVEQIHNKLETLLGNEGAYLDGIYVCPHHKDRGFLGERIEYKIECNCRKPKTGLIESAAKEMNIDVAKSIMIGDSSIDEECGRNAGCMKSIRIKDGYTLFDAIKSLDLRRH